MLPFLTDKLMDFPGLGTSITRLRILRSWAKWVLELPMGVILCKMVNSAFKHRNKRFKLIQGQKVAVLV